MPASGEFALFQLTPQDLTCQSEPPWIKRCNYGIKFTDEMQFAEDIDFCNTSERKKEEDMSEDEEKINKKEELEIASVVKPRANSEKKTITKY